MLVLGIDPGTVRMGYGVLTSGESVEVDDYGVIALPDRMPLEQRLYQLYTHVVNMIAIFHPTVIAVEKPFVGRGERQFSGPAIAVGQAQAVVFIAGASQGIPIFQYSPAQIKSSVADFGAASKEQMQQTIAAILGLPDTPQSDAADALSVCLCHVMRSQSDLALSREIPPGLER